MVQVVSKAKSARRKVKCGPTRIAGGLGIVALLAMTFSWSVVHRQSSLPGKAIQTKSRREPEMQVVFSTSCSYQHDWQSYLFFFHAMLHKQPGHVTRVVSGCTEEQEKELAKLHQQQIVIMNEQFHIHFTPEFGKVEGRSWQTTKYWNKPFGIKHWLEHKFGYKYEGEISTPHDDDIVVLVDPDMLMQRPFVNDFSQFPKTMWHRTIRDKELYYKVDHGKPIAQTYSFNDAWLTAVQQGNMEDIVGEGSPALTVSEYDAEVTFSAGPPYILTARDMYRVAFHWAKFLPGINLHFDGMMAEMYGYCTAVAHLNLRHQIAKGMMVSNVNMDHGEGWEFMHNVTDEACDIAKVQDRVPHVVHFCQRYSIGEFFLSKYKVPESILSCDHQLFELPPKDIAASTNYSHFGDGSIKEWSEGKRVGIYRNAFMVCSIMDGLNRAATFYKDHHCMDGANYDTTWNHFREQKLQNCKSGQDCPV